MHVKCDLCGIATLPSYPSWPPEDAFAYPFH